MARDIVGRTDELAAVARQAFREAEAQVAAATATMNAAWQAWQVQSAAANTWFSYDERLAHALAGWDAAEPVAGTAGESWLADLGLVGLVGSPELRFDPAALQLEATADGALVGACCAIVRESPRAHSVAVGGGRVRVSADQHRAGMGWIGASRRGGAGDGYFFPISKPGPGEGTGHAANPRRLESLG